MRLPLRRCKLGLKRLAWWASALVGAVLIAAAVAAHLDAKPGLLRARVFYLGPNDAGFAGSVYSSITDEKGAIYTQRYTLQELDMMVFDAKETSIGIRVPAPVPYAFTAPGVFANFFPKIRNQAIIAYGYSNGDRDRYARAYFAAQAFPHEWMIDASAASIGVMLRIHAAWLWSLGVPMLAVPVAIRWRSRRRRRKDACKKCGYDLVGLPAGAACPECGAGTPS